MELSKGAQQLLARYEAWNQSLQPQGNTTNIVVDDVAAKVASFYEKIRGVVDWREEHLLRKTAIERMFKRRILFNGNSSEMAEPLLNELIRSGHFPNNRIPTSAIQEIQQVINKYAFLVEKGKTYADKKNHSFLEDWVLNIGACEIEEILASPLREKALIEFMTQDMEETVSIRQKDQDRVSEDQRKLQIFVGVQRALFKLDEPTISLHILERFYPTWNSLTNEELVTISQKLESIHTTINKILRYPFAERFYQLIERLDTPYLILGDIVSNHPTNFLEIVHDPTKFEEDLGNAYDIRLSKLKNRMRRAAFFSTISVFLSKVLIAISIEIPIDGLNYQTLIWSVSIPPLLLLFLISTKRASSRENLQKVLLEVTKITYQNERRTSHTIAFPSKRKSFMGFIVRITYWLSFFLSFGILIHILQQFHFSTLSMVVFLLFLSLVSYAGMRIRQRSQELMIGEQKEEFLFNVLDFFLLPVTQVGKWLSGQLSRYNVLVLLLNVLIETPFQIFVEFIDQLRSFWKEKKEQIH